MNDYSEIVKALHEIAAPDLWEIIAGIGSIVLSVVAVVISIVTARKQNRIALYEQRREVASLILKFCGFAELLQDRKEEIAKASSPKKKERLKEEIPELILILCNSAFGTKIHKINEEDEVEYLRVISEFASDMAGKSGAIINLLYLFGKRGEKMMEDVADINILFGEIIGLAICGEYDEEKVDLYIKKAIQLGDNSEKCIIKLV